MYCNVYALAHINSFHRGGRQNISSKASERIIFPHKYRPLINYNIKKNLDTGTTEQFLRRVPVPIYLIFFYKIRPI